VVLEAPAESGEWEQLAVLPVSALEQAVPAQLAAVEALWLVEREALEMEPEVPLSEGQAAPAPAAGQWERQREPVRPAAAVVRLRPAALAAVATK
jgi:hypothetical protein